MTKARDLANGATALSAVSPTELGYLDGVTSAVQTQIDAKATYPTQTGNSGKFLTTDGTNPSWGTVLSGKVLQIVNFSTTSPSTVTGTTLTDTNITASITPSSSSSKILIIGSIACQMYSSGSVNQLGMGLNLLRGSTVVYDSNANGEGWYATTSYTGYHQFSGIQTINYLDSPSTTSSTTYKIQIRSNTSANTAKTSDNSRTSSLMLIEIAG